MVEFELFMEHHLTLKMELDGKIITLDLQLQMDAFVESDFLVIGKSLSKWESQMAVKRVELS